MKLLAEGRASEVFDLGDGRVLRRFKAGGRPEAEALVMEHVRAHGYPVPRVLDVSRNALVLERIDGPTMVDDLGRRPWRLRGHARALAQLHHRLHAIAPPKDGLAGTGDTIVHHDLHPVNVLLGPNGPVVIDWTNARLGQAAVDVALTWLIAATHGSFRARTFARQFAGAAGVADVRRGLPGAAAFRLADPNVLPQERRRIEGLLERGSPV